MAASTYTTSTPNSEKDELEIKMLQYVREGFQLLHSNENDQQKYKPNTLPQEKTKSPNATDFVESLDQSKDIRDVKFTTDREKSPHPDDPAKQSAPVPVPKIRFIYSPQQMSHATRMKDSYLSEVHAAIYGGNRDFPLPNSDEYFREAEKIALKGKCSDAKTKTAPLSTTQPADSPLFPAAKNYFNFTNFQQNSILSPMPQQHKSPKPVTKTPPGFNYLANASYTPNFSNLIQQQQMQLQKQLQQLQQQQQLQQLQQQQQQQAACGFFFSFYSKMIQKTQTGSYNRQQQRRQLGGSNISNLSLATANIATNSPNTFATGLSGLNFLNAYAANDLNLAASSAVLQGSLANWSNANNSISEQASLIENANAINSYFLDQNNGMELNSTATNTKSSANHNIFNNDF